MQEHWNKCVDNIKENSPLQQYKQLFDKKKKKNNTNNLIKNKS